MLTKKRTFDESLELRSIGNILAELQPIRTRYRVEAGHFLIWKSKNELSKLIIFWIFKSDLLDIIIPFEGCSASKIQKILKRAKFSRTSS